PIGSRRTYEVCPFMYSPADLPSRTRAAPAKNRIWSTDGGISSLIVSPMGLPVLRLSTATKSAARDSSASAILRSARWRSDGVVSRHVSKAAAAASIAESTSAGPETGALVYASPVVGSIRSAYEPSFVSTYSPLTKLRNLLESLMSLSHVSAWRSIAGSPRAHPDQRTARPRKPHPPAHPGNRISGRQGAVRRVPCTTLSHSFVCRCPPVGGRWQPLVPVPAVRHGRVLGRSGGSRVNIIACYV